MKKILMIKLFLVINIISLILIETKRRAKYNDQDDDDDDQSSYYERSNYKSIILENKKKNAKSERQNRNNGNIKSKNKKPVQNNSNDYGKNYISNDSKTDLLNRRNQVNYNNEKNSEATEKPQNSSINQTNLYLNNNLPNDQIKTIDNVDNSIKEENAKEDKVMISNSSEEKYTFINQSTKSESSNENHFNDSDNIVLSNRNDSINDSIKNIDVLHYEILDDSLSENSKKDEEKEINLKVISFEKELFSFLETKFSILHKKLISQGFTYPYDLIIFFSFGFLLKFLLHLLRRKPSFVYNKREENDLTILNDLKTKELLGMMGKNSNESLNMDKIQRNEGIINEQTHENIVNELEFIDKKVKEIYSSNSFFEDKIADSFLNLFNLIDQKDLYENEVINNS